MLRAQPFPHQRGINDQRIIGMHKRLFAPRLPAGSSQAAENDIDRIDHLRQGIRKLRIVRVKYAGDIGQRPTRGRGNGFNRRRVKQHS